LLKLDGQATMKSRGSPDGQSGPDLYDKQIIFFACSRGLEFDTPALTDK